MQVDHTRRTKQNPGHTHPQPPRTTVAFKVVAEQPRSGQSAAPQTHAGQQGKPVISGHRLQRLLEPFGMSTPRAHATSIGRPPGLRSVDIPRLWGPRCVQRGPIRRPTGRRTAGRGGSAPSRRRRAVRSRSRCTSCTANSGWDYTLGSSLRWSSEATIPQGVSVRTDRRIFTAGASRVPELRRTLRHACDSHLRWCYPGG